MQVSQADVTSKRVGVEEHLINFKSSPNLKKMKKFIRSKMDHIEIEKRASTSVAPEPPPPPNIHKTEKKLIVQPPLPLDPPPPDEHLPFILKVKTEVEDTEYQENPTEELNSVNQEKVENNTTKVMPEKKVAVCRDFIRGTCKRPGTCKFAHKFDISQLVGVYTFCRNFQTSVCTRPNCKYVHASVFAEHNFYRTGYLPPNALAHAHNAGLDRVLMPPPPPPPPKEYGQESQSLPVAPKPGDIFSNPPPPLQPGQHYMCNMPASSVRTNEPMPGPSSGTSLKRDWSMHTQQYNNPIPNLEADELVAKKCRNCDDSETRLQYHEHKLVSMRRSKEELNMKISQLDKKSEKINTIILALLKPSFSKTMIHANGVNTLNGDKEKWILEQLNTLYNPNSRRVLGDDQ